MFYLVSLYNRMIDNMYVYGHNYCIEKSDFLEIFQKPPDGLFIAAWRAVHSRHATYICLPISRFLKRNRLAVHSHPPGDACWKTQFFEFWLSCPAVMNTRQATRATLAQFLCFLGSGENLIGGKDKGTC